MCHPRYALRGLAESMASIYYGNLSVFQSLPDTWAIEQVFPVMPIHRLTERPGRIAYIADITCDSDGCIDRFASLSGDLSTLPLSKGEKAVRDGRLSVADRQAMIRACKDSLQEYNYFER